MRQPHLSLFFVLPVFAFCGTFLIVRNTQLETTRADYSSALDYKFAPPADSFVRDDKQTPSELAAMWTHTTSCRKYERFFFRNENDANQMLRGLVDYRGMGGQLLHPAAPAENLSAHISRLAVDGKLLYVLEANPGRLTEHSSGTVTAGFLVEVCQADS